MLALRARNLLFASQLNASVRRHVRTSKEQMMVWVRRESLDDLDWHRVFARW